MVHDHTPHLCSRQTHDAVCQESAVAYGTTRPGMGLRDCVARAGAGQVKFVFGIFRPYLEDGLP